MDQNGLYDYSEVEPKRVQNIQPRKFRVMLSPKQKLLSLLTGFFFGLGAIVISIIMVVVLEFTFEYYVFAIPVALLTFWIKKDANITAFVFIGFILGSYVVSYILGFLFIGYLLFI